MKLYYDKRLSDPTYYVQEGIRNGKKTTTRNVLRIGKHSELLEITDDPLAYALSIIDKMNKEHRVGKDSVQMSIDFNEKVDASSQSASSSTALNIGYFFIQDTLRLLQLKECFKRLSSDRKFSFDAYTILRFLTYARILDPSSKYGTWDRLDTYYEQPDIAYQHILRFMDVIQEDEKAYIEWLYRKSASVVRRDTSVLYYDCSNFYFETEQEDDDVTDEVTGEVVRGLRKYGYDKEHRPNPIVEMGLFMDRNGIPVSMCIEPGNTNEQTTAIPLEREVVRMLDGSKFIYCSDAGLGSYNIRRYNDMGGRAFIITQSIKKLSDVLKTAVFNDYDYKLLSNNSPVSIEMMKSFDRFDEKNLALYQDTAYKEIPANKLMELGLNEVKMYKNGNIRKVKAKGTMHQKVIVTFSRKYMEYQRTVRARQVARAQALLNSNDPEEIKKGPIDVRRFLKRVTSTKNGEKVRVGYVLDEAKIAEEEKYDGYYAVATNLDDDAKDILAVADERYKIEECFRIMKTNFSGRPVYHRDPDRIRAHFLICYTALLVYRIMEYRLDQQGTHVTTEDLIRTMKNMDAANVHDVEYMALYTDSSALEAMTRLSGLILNRKHYRPKELNSMIKKILR